jgi:thioredoxin-related protein
MLRSLTGAVLLAAAFATAAPVGAEPPDRYPFVDYDTGQAAARNSGTPIFVYFGRFGCGYCEKTNREAFADARLRELYPRHFTLVYVDTEGGRRLTLPTGERISEREFGARMNVLVTPLFAYLEPDGREIFRIPGIQTAGDFLLYDRFVTEGRYRNQSIRDYLARETR